MPPAPLAEFFNLQSASAGARRDRYAIVGLVYGILYFALDYASVGLQIAPGVSAWYPPSALSLVLLAGVSLWYAPLVFAVGLIAEVFNYHQSLYSIPMLIETLDVTLGYLIAAAILRRILNLEKTFHKVRDVGRYLGVIAVAAFAVAFVGVSAINLDPDARVTFWRTVFNWWVGDTVALASVAPFLFLLVLPWLQNWLGLRPPVGSLSWFEDPARVSKPSRWRGPLLLAQFGSAALVLFVVFGTKITEHYNLFYLCFVPVVWIAASGGAKRSSVGLVFINSGAVVAILTARPTAISFAELQLLMLVISVTGISLGAAVDEGTLNEEKLQASTLHLNSLIDNSPLAIVSHDLTGRVTMANPAFEHLFGYRRSELIGRALNPLIAPSDMEQEASDITRDLCCGVAIHTLTRRVRNTGEAVNVELYGVPLFANGKVRGGYGIYKDITNQKKMEEELALSQKLQAVGRLAGGVAHDFNNILGVVQGYSEYLLEQLQTSDPLRESAEEILHSAHRGSGLVRQLLLFSRKQAIEYVVLDLNSVVANVETLLKRLIGDDIDLKVKLSRDLGRIKADSGQVEQIILNLAVNARDAMARGGTIEIETVNALLDNSRSGQSTSFVMLLFRDSGTGMTPETLSHIFEPFFTTKEKGKGTGLGLSTVYGIVEQSGGEVRVESELGSGATFRIYFPRVESPVLADRQEQVQPHSPGGRETILLVEDQDDFRRMTAGYLKRNGYSVVDARNGAEAIQLSSSRLEPIDLLLSDVVMPGLRGPQLAKVLAPSRPEMAILLMSGYTDGSVDDDPESTRRFTLIHKPFTWSLLGTTIRQVIESRARAESDVTLSIDDLAAR